MHDPTEVDLPRSVPPDLADAIRDVVDDYERREELPLGAMRTAIQALCDSHPEVREARVTARWLPTLTLTARVDVLLSMRAPDPEVIEVRLDLDRGREEGRNK